MNTEPSVTAIIPYKDNFKYLSLAINSVFNQTYKNLKVLIVYDNEKKIDLYKIRDYLKKKTKNRSISVKIEINKKNLGAGYSRNKGIMKSNTKYIAFLDSDDLWAKNKLKTQISFMEKNNQVFSHTSYYVINELNKIISERASKSVITFDQLINSCDIGLSTVILNLKFIKKNKFFFPKIKTKEDYVLWLKISKKLKFMMGINKKLTYYRKTKNSLSSSKLLGLINGYKVYRNYLKLDIISSIYRLIILSFNYLKKSLKNNNKTT